MKPRLQALAVSTCLLSAAAFAQEEDLSEMHQENMNIQMGLPGAAVNVDVNVRQTSHTTTSQPAPGYAPAPAAPPPAQAYGNQRDCGTGPDSGCETRRRGKLPMDAETFNGVVHSLRNTDSEITRFDMAKDMFKSNHMTAKQLAVFLDLFESEIYRLDVAKLAAPRVVNPKHALGLSSKFESSLYGADYTKTMSAQR